MVCHLIMSFLIDIMFIISYNIFMSDQYELEIYSTLGGYEPFSDWLSSLKDQKAKRTILLRLQRLREGNLGDFKFFDSLLELRIHIGPGYRVYCAKTENKLILLLGGGDKSSQEKDIRKCKLFLAEHQRRMYE